MIINGTELSVAGTSLEQFSLVAIYYIVVQVETSYGHQDKLFVEINVTDDTCMDQELEIGADDHVAFDVATGQTNFTAISISQTISVCPTQLKLDITSPLSKIIIRHITINENFQISFLDGENMELGEYELKIVALDKKRGTRAEIKKV